MELKAKIITCAPLTINIEDKPLTANIILKVSTSLSLGIIFPNKVDLNFFNYFKGLANAEFKITVIKFKDSLVKNFDFNAMPFSYTPSSMTDTFVQLGTFECPVY